MRKSVLPISLFFLLFIFVWILQINSKNHSFNQPSQGILGSEITSAPAISSSCHEHSGLPDPACTPGSIDPTVSQDNIQSTICVSGYTKTIRPPVSYTQSLKKEQIMEYGYIDKNLRHYEEDHLISLELGGNPTDPKNLWPEPGASPNLKDSIENLCHQKVCDGEISLIQAQKEIATDWETACQ